MQLNSSRMITQWFGNITGQKVARETMYLRTENNVWMLPIRFAKPAGRVWVRPLKEDCRLVLGFWKKIRIFFQKVFFQNRCQITFWRSKKIFFLVEKTMGKFLRFLNFASTISHSERTNMSKSRISEIHCFSLPFFFGSSKFDLASISKKNLDL